ncbi:hypothetical protein NTJ28_002604, partial [Flavobacterium psychrophilum]|nr:hypothetical protein [Flavobacterium psychrophilum]
NTSLIIIENKENYSTENELLKNLGFDNFEQKQNTTFDEILNPKDNQIGIGYYNGNLIICDGYLLTTKSLDESENLNLSEYEKTLVQIFPKSEIVTVSCVSSVNFHGYSLIQNGEKKRLKYVDSEMKQEFGKRFEEETEIYKNSYEEDGKLLWKNENDEDDFFTEDQLMEDFTFKVAKRRLGVQIDMEDGEDLFENTEFKVFQLNNSSKNLTKETEKTEKTETNNFKWKKYLIIGGIIIVVRILMKTIFK